MVKERPAEVSTAVRLPAALLHEASPLIDTVPASASGEVALAVVETVAVIATALLATVSDAETTRSGAEARAPEPETSAVQLLAVGASSGDETMTLSDVSTAGPTLAAFAEVYAADQPAPQAKASAVAADTDWVLE